MTAANSGFSEAAVLAADKQSTPADAAGTQRLAQDSAASFDVAEIFGEPGQSIPLRISLPAETGARPGLVMIRGLPPQLKLSSGFRTGDAWMASIQEVPNLQLIVPDNFEGSFALEVILVTGGGADRQSRIALANIAPAQKAETFEPRQQPTNAVDGPAERETAPPTLTISPQAEAAMLAKAAQLLQGGDISAARLIYEHLANNGSALGALSLAKTYDPGIFFDLQVVGMEPDAALAQRWYERAAELGDASAKQHLKNLAASSR